MYTMCANMHVKKSCIIVTISDLCILKVMVHAVVSVVQRFIACVLPHYSRSASGRDLGCKTIPRWDRRFKVARMN
jgi:hypothetical protein